MKPHNILVVEDDPKTRDLICQILKNEGYQTRTADSIFFAKGEVEQRQPDLVVLDRRLSDGDGLEFCRQLRAMSQTQKLPVLFLTSKNSTSDRVIGLKMGGDDYLVKPFQSEELLARVEALLRRMHPEELPATKVLSVNGVTLDMDRHLCTVGNRKITLWPKEYELLQVFLERPGRLLSKEFLSERVWGRDFFDSSRAIDTAVQRLRHKLGAKGRHLETVKGYGYRFQEEN